MNRRFSRSCRTALVALAAAGLLTFGLAGCNVNPEKSPAFTALQARVKKIEDDAKKNSDAIKGLEITAQTLDSDLRALKAEVSKMDGNPQQADAQNKRIEKIEQEVQTLQGKTAGTAASGSKPAADSAKKGDEKTKPSSGAKPSPTAKGSGSTKSSGSAKPSAEAPSSPKSGGGKYTTVQAGDTLQSLAQKYGTTASKIAKENNLQNPQPDAALVPGTSIFVPNP